MGKPYMADVDEHKHDHFVWVTPRYNPINARYDSVKIYQVNDADLYSPFGHKGVLFEPAIEHNGMEEQKAK